jgi:hypothetical protein
VTVRRDWIGIAVLVIGALPLLPYPFAIGWGNFAFPTNPAQIPGVRNALSSVFCYGLLVYPLIDAVFVAGYLRARRGPRKTAWLGSSAPLMDLLTLAALIGAANAR